MRSTRVLFSLAIVVALAAPFEAKADNGSYAGAGGTFTTGTAAGQNIHSASVPLTGTTATLTFSCPITTFSSGTYALNWGCAGGTVSITSSDSSVTFNGTFSSGSMNFSGSGGGKGGHTTYWYSFYGSVSGTVTAGGVSQAAYGSISQSVKTTAQIGAAGAPVTSVSFGWNSAYSPVLVGDLTNARILGADNISGTNLVAYGTPGTGTGQFGAIGGLAQDSTGHIYATDSVVDRLVRIDNLSGANWVQLGSSGVGLRHFSQPKGVALDAAGKIWVADAGNNRIVRMDNIGGVNWTSFGTLGTGANQFSAPSGIAFDSLGRIYVADTGNNRIVRFDDLTGKNWTTLSAINISIYAYQLTSPTAVAVTAGGKIYISLTSGYLFSVNDITGTGGTGSLWNSAISSISLDQAGTLYAAGSFTPGLGQVLDAAATGYFTGALGNTAIQTSAIVATHSSSPPPADPALSATALAFANQNVGEPSAAQSVTLTNLGSAPLTASSIYSTTDFKIAKTCGGPLAGGASCTVNVQFDPTVPGARTASLVVLTNGVHPVTKIPMSGFATYSTAIVLPGALHYLSQKTGTTSGAQTVTLSNTGTGPLTITSIANTGDFTTTNNCLSVVAPGDGCTIQVSFAPTATGARTGVLTLTDDAHPPLARQAVALSGTGTSAMPAFTVSPESLLFPSEQVGASSAAQTVTLTNNSGVAAALTAPGYTAGFAGTSSCGSVLNTASSCAFQVQFTPAAAGPVTGALTIPITGQPTLSVGLSGTGAAASTAAALAPSPALVDFGQLVVGDNPALSVTLTNSTHLPAGIRSISLAGPSTFSITGNNCPSLLAGSGSCSVQITFIPTAMGTFGATLTVTESSGAATQVPITALVNTGGM